MVKICIAIVFYIIIFGYNIQLLITLNYKMSTSTWVKTNTPLKWIDVAISGNGQYMAAIENGSDGNGGNIYLSINYGISWFTTTDPGIDIWRSIAISENGQYITAVSIYAIWSSNNWGYLFTQPVLPIDIIGSSPNFTSISISPDGQTQMASCVTLSTLQYNSGLGWISSQVNPSSDSTPISIMQSYILYNYDYSSNWTIDTTYDPPQSSSSLPNNMNDLLTYLNGSSAPIVYTNYFITSVATITNQRSIIYNSYTIDINQNTLSSTYSIGSANCIENMSWNYEASVIQIPLPLPSTIGTNYYIPGFYIPKQIALTSNGSMQYCIIPHNGIYQSSTNNNIWTLASETLQDPSSILQFSIDSTGQNILVTGNTNLINLSQDGGNTWSQSNTQFLQSGVDTYRQICALSGNGNYQVIIENTGGIFINSLNMAGSGQGPDPVCFAKGTYILTNKGYVLIENLKMGDTLITCGKISNNNILDKKISNALVNTSLKHDFPTQQIQWISHFEMSQLNENSYPILFKKGCIDKWKKIPSMDLRVSPEHSICIKNRMIPAKNLINGTTIYQDMSFKTVTYYHIEMPYHCAIISNGLLTESYLDTGNREIFDPAPKLKSGRIVKPKSIL